MVLGQFLHIVKQEPDQCRKSLPDLTDWLTLFSRPPRDFPAASKASVLQIEGLKAVWLLIEVSTMFLCCGLERLMLLLMCLPLPF